MHNSTLTVVMHPHDTTLEMKQRGLLLMGKSLAFSMRSTEVELTHNSLRDKEELRCVPIVAQAKRLLNLSPPNLYTVEDGVSWPFMTTSRF